MPGMVVKGAVETVPGLTVRSWKDDSRLRLRMGEDGSLRPATWLRGIVLHTTEGIPGGADKRPQLIKPGVGPQTDIAARTNTWWSTNGTSAGAHLIVDFDGSIACLADLELEMAYHATSVNPRTIGIEIAQSKKDAGLYAGQIDAVVALVDWLTARFGIQRQVHGPYTGPIDRMAQGGRDVVGVYGHRDQTHSRGVGDPGDAVFEALSRASYERFDFGKREDLDAWMTRQRDLFANDAGLVDGVAGPATVAALRDRGYPDGLWVRRA